MRQFCKILTPPLFGILVQHLMVVDEEGSNGLLKSDAMGPTPCMHVLPPAFKWPGLGVAVDKRQVEDASSPPPPPPLDMPLGDRGRYAVGGLPMALRSSSR